MNFIINVIYGTDDAIFAVLVILGYLLAIMIAIVVHEVAHGLAAYMNGDLTAKVAGRLSPNPVVHFDLIGFIMLLVVGFGYAKPVPVNPYNFKKPKRGLLMVSLAGVVANFILAVISIFFLVLTMFIVSQNGISTNFGYYSFTFFYNFLHFMSIININLMLFNLLPLGSLDGLKVLEALCRRGNKVTEFLRKNGNLILYILVGLSFVSSYLVDISPIFYYFDILGLYLIYGRYAIMGGIMSLFTMMFGLGYNGFDFLAGTLPTWQKIIA